MKTEIPLWQQTEFDIPLDDLRQELGEAKWNSTFAHSHLFHSEPLFTPESSDAAEPSAFEAGAAEAEICPEHSFVLAVPNTAIRDKILKRHIVDLQRLIARHTKQPEERINLEVRVAELPQNGLAESSTVRISADRESVGMKNSPSAVLNAGNLDPSRLADIDFRNNGLRQLDHNREIGNGAVSSQVSCDDFPSGWAQSHPASARTDPRFTFDNFVSGSTNRFAYQAALAVAETPGTAYNPLFIFGNVGLGKTHLLQAIAYFVKTHYPHKTLRYMATEAFLNDFLMSIRNKQSEQFRQRYRKLDVLILDDIQILEGKEAMQEELFHTFNHMYDQNKQLVFSSDRPPDALLTLQDRLRSRFKSGLLTDIQPPAIEVRLAILEQSVEHHNARRDRSTQPPIIIPENALMFIAENFADNIRELEGALTKVIAHAQLLRIPPSYESAKEILGDLINHSSSEKLTAGDIIDLATEFFSLPKEELLGPRRTKDLVTARHITMYALREHTDLSLPTIGSLFDGRDHTSVLHAVNKITEKMQTDNNIHSQVLHLTNQITKGKAVG